MSRNLRWSGRHKTRIALPDDAGKNQEKFGPDILCSGSSGISSRHGTTMPVPPAGGGLPRPGGTSVRRHDSHLVPFLLLRLVFLDAGLVKPGVQPWSAALMSSGRSSRRSSPNPAICPPCPFRTSSHDASTVKGFDPDGEKATTLPRRQVLISSPRVSWASSIPWGRLTTPRTSGPSASAAAELVAVGPRHPEPLPRRRRCRAAIPARSSLATSAAAIPSSRPKSASHHSCPPNWAVQAPSFVRPRRPGDDAHQLGMNGPYLRGGLKPSSLSLAAIAVDLALLP